MISYQQKQLRIFRKLEKNFKKNKNPISIVSPVKNYIEDNRICLTSVTFLPENIQNIIISKIINPLKNLDEKQYYYLPESLHITIQNVRKINYPPLFTEDNIQKVIEVFSQIIPKHRSFNFQLEGLFKLPFSLSICAFSDESLCDLVLDLKNGLKKIGLPDDKKYASDNIFFGNINVCRYTTYPNQKFIEKVSDLKNIEIGSIKLETISLITTNSVCHPNKTTITEKFKLRKN